MAVNRPRRAPFVPRVVASNDPHRLPPKLLGPAEEAQVLPSLTYGPSARRLRRRRLLHRVFVGLACIAIAAAFLGGIALWALQIVALP